MIKMLLHVLMGFLPVMVIGAERVDVGDFDDSLAKISATLEATPSQQAARVWTASYGGSVRLVGSLKKLSMKGEAEVDIQVDGHSIWRKKLSADDSIRHGFDVTAYDLCAGSKIHFRVMAREEPVGVQTAYQIVPEPFVSRWRANLPAGYPAWSEGHRTALLNKGQEILQKLRDASVAKVGKIVIPPGDYLFHADWSRASTLAGLENLEIVAEGVTFWFEPPLVHALLFEKCRKVTVRGLTIDFTIPCWFQAQVTEIDRVAKTLQATIVAGYEPRDAYGKPEVGGKRALMFYGADGRFINHRYSPGSWQLGEDGKTIVCRDIEISGIPGSLAAGDYVVGTLRTGAALRSVNCTEMRFEGVNIWSSPGMAVNESGGEGGHVYLRVRATRRPHTNRLQAFGADIFHLASADRGPILDRCELAYGADDNLNIHGSFGRVVQRIGEDKYYLEGSYAVGDSIEFRDQCSVEFLGIAKVVSIEPIANGPSVPISDTHQAKGEVRVELDKALELPPLSLVVLDGKRSAAGFVLRNCWLHDNFQRTLINGSPGGLIENNTLQNVGHGLMIQFETWGPWMEGPFARDLMVLGNRFLDSPPDGAALSVSMHTPCGGSPTRRFEARPVRNLTITDNYFARATSTPLIIHNVDGLKIQGNSIDYTADAPKHVGIDTTSGDNWLYLQDCVHIAVEGNQIRGSVEVELARPHP
jgi:hypothetical protein